MLNANSYLTGIKAFRKDDDEDDMILDAKARDKREKDFFEAKKKREEERKVAMERAKKLKAEREARERAAKETREKAEKERAARAKAAKEAAKKTRSTVKDLHKGHSTGGNTGGNQPVKTPSGKPQGLMTAAQRDAEEKSYYESPIKNMHQAGKTGVSRYTDTDTGEYKAKTAPTSSDYAKEIAWREKQDALVYEDFANRWKPGSGILGAGSKAYAENVEHEWKDFTSGQIPIPDLTFFDSVEAQKSSRDISATEVTLDKAIPGAIAGATLGLPFIGASIPVAIAGSALSSIGGSVVGSVIDPSLESSGPSETFRIIARDEDQKITTFYEATKYNQGGIDMITTIRADGVVDGIVTRDYYPYDSFKGE